LNDFDFGKAILKNRLIQLIKPPSPSYNYRSQKVRKWANELVAKHAKVANIGSGAKRLVPGVINIDLFADPQIDIVGNATIMPFRTASLDAILCCALLEHVQDPAPVIGECIRCLKPGGLIYVELPFLQPLHMVELGDYRRFSKSGLEKIFSDFNLIESGICIGPFSVLSWYFRKFPTIFSHCKYANYFLEFIFGWLTFWIKYFDIFVKSAKNLDIVNGGVYLLGQKK